MLSIKVLTRKDIGRAASYYSAGADDYYRKEGESISWQGKGAHALELEREVDPKDLKNLLAGQIGPNIRVSRGSTRNDAKERIGIDLTFSAPKSVSLQALVAGDVRVIEAHDRAVTAAIAAAEECALARKRVDGKAQVERSANLVVAKFRHETSRECDPQLHTHAVVMNLTQRSDGAWRALKNDEIVKSVKKFGAVYRAELAIELQKIGFELRHERDGSFELSHISREQLEAFSQRSKQINEGLADLGLSREEANTNQIQNVVLKSRAKKTNIDREILYKDWVDRASGLGIDFLHREWAGQGNEFINSQRRSINNLTLEQNANLAVKYAVKHLTERQSVVSEKDLIDIAMKHGVGRVTLKDIVSEVEKRVDDGFLIREEPLYKPASEASENSNMTKSDWIKLVTTKGLEKEAATKKVENAIREGGLIAVDKRYTTQTAYKIEKSILKIERSGRERMDAIMDVETARTVLAATNLNDGQREAAELMASTKNRVIGVQGFAGTGKSHMLDTAKTLIEDQGYRVRALAPYGSQVKNLREMGVPANTLAAFLRGQNKDLDDRTVLVIDEAGVVPSRLMEQTLRLAEEKGARVVLLGDTAQTKAIEAGRPFDQLQAAGMATARMDHIQRQRDPDLLAAVEHAAKGHAPQSLDKIKSVLEVREDDLRRSALVRDFMALGPSDRDQTLIVSGTNEARRDINARVREAVGTAGQGLVFDTLIRRDTTQAERLFSKNYRVGDVVQPERDYKSGLQRGELYKIVDTGPGNRLTVSAQDGQKIAFSPMHARRLSVYQPERSELAPGDMVRVTRNDKKLDLATGERFRVAAVAPGRVTLEGGGRRLEMPADTPLHLDHAYATTVHGAQGLTCDNVMIEAQTDSRTTAKDVYYVAISRAKYKANIYTNDLSKLPKSISRDNVKTAALDLKQFDKMKDQHAKSVGLDKGNKELDRERQR